MHLSHTWLCHIWFFGCECESNKMPHGAWKSEKVCVYAVCVVRRSTFRSNAIKTVTIIQQFALWLLFVRKALHLINILARCSFVSDTDLHLPLNGMAKRNSLSSSLSISCSNNTKTHGEYVISMKLTEPELLIQFLSFFGFLPLYSHRLVTWTWSFHQIL